MEGAADSLDPTVGSDGQGMLQINIGDHRSTEPGWVPIPRHHRHAMLWARERAGWIARNLRTADRYFATLRFRRTLTSLVADGSLWVNFEDTDAYYGATEALARREIVITPVAFDQGKWVVLATLIHELAHVAGASGAGHAAEQAVLECGLGRRSEYKRGRDDHRTPYVPGIRG